MSFVAHYSTHRLEDYWDSWLNGLAALGYVADNIDPDIQNGADTFKVEYCTVDYDGTLILASGMLAFPSTWCSAPTVVYSHGTSVTRIDTPSNPNVDEVFDGPSPMVIFAGGGYVYLAPDLTGFGDSGATQHRYFHAQTEADSTLDMLTAVEDYWLYDWKANGTLFNAGFSSGGNTALAFAEAAEAAGVEIEATSVVGAVLQPDDWFMFLLEAVEASYLQLYTADLLVSYNTVYGDIYGDPADAFSPPLDTTMEGLFDMNHTFAEVVEALPGSAAEFLTPDFYDAVQCADHPMRVHLRENRVDDVCLDSPIRMYHMVDDDEVPDHLAAEARDQLAACNDVELIEWIDADHLNTWHEVLPEMRAYFDSF